jgi:glycosyltransferase involved in cell wall biosynthesis
MASKSEGMPLSLLEAMSSGVVPIVPNVGDIRDVAREDNAIVYKDIDDSLIKKIRNLTKNKKEYSRMQLNAIKSIKPYSDNNVTQFWEGIFQDKI